MWSLSTVPGTQYVTTKLTVEVSSHNLLKMSPSNIVLPSHPFSIGSIPNVCLVTASNFKPKISRWHSFSSPQYSTTYRLNDKFIHHQHTLLIMGEGKKKKEHFKIIWFRKKSDAERILFFVLSHSPAQRRDLIFQKAWLWTSKEGTSETEGTSWRTPNTPYSYSVLTNNFLMSREVPWPPTISSRVT